MKHKLNLGCGARKIDGWINVDLSPVCQPDAVVDLDDVPWPFADGCADEVVLSHVLEHLGHETTQFFGIIKELYRTCCHDARVRIFVPHPRHDDFLVDPSHVRPILPETLQMFSKVKNREWQAQGAANTPLALYLDVDFEVERVNFDLDGIWHTQWTKGELTEGALLQASRQHLNVIKQIDCTLKVIKA